MSLLPGMALLEPRVHSDARGTFFEVWRTADLDVHFVQQNQSGSVRGVLRGLHYQLQRPQGKLVRVVSGEIWDVAVDLRRSSPTFGHWSATTLTAENHRAIWIPPGFAHGFLTVSERAEVLYMVTETWDPDSERVLAWDGAGIDWPLNGPPILSARDAVAPALDEAEVYP